MCFFDEVFSFEKSEKYHKLNKFDIKIKISDQNFQNAVFIFIKLLFIFVLLSFMFYLLPMSAFFLIKLPLVTVKYRKFKFSCFISLIRVRLRTFGKTLEN